MPCKDRVLSILYISLYYPPDMGAASTRAKALCEEWVTGGQDVTVVTCRSDLNWDGEGDRSRWLRREERNGVRTITVKSLFAPSNASFFKRTLGYLWFMVAAIFIGLREGKRDFAIATSPQIFMGISAWVLGLLWGVPFVFEIRDHWPDSLVAMTGLDNRFVIESIAALSTFLYERADRIVAVTPGVKEAIVATGTDPDKVWVHTNGADASLFSDGEGTSPFDSEDTNEDRFTVVNVGSLEEGYALTTVLETAAMIEADPGYDDVLFAFIGEGTMENELKWEAEQNGLDNLVFLGARPQEELPKYLCGADIGLAHLRGHPIFETAIPMKTFEYMAAGLPIILGAEGDAVELIIDGGAGILIEQEDPDALRDAVEELYDDRARRESLGARGREIVRDEYNWETIATNYLCDLGRISR